MWTILVFSYQWAIDSLTTERCTVHEPNAIQFIPYLYCNIMHQHNQNEKNPHTINERRNSKDWLGKRPLHEQSLIELGSFEKMIHSCELDQIQINTDQLTHWISNSFQEKILNYVFETNDTCITFVRFLRTFIPVHQI